MKKSKTVILLVIAMIFGFFIVTANDRGRYIISVLPVMVAITIAFRPRKH